MSGNNGVMALWQTSSTIAANIRNYSGGNIIGIGITPGENVPEGKDYGFSGYADYLVMLNPQVTHIAECAVKTGDLSPGRHNLLFSDGTCFSYTITGRAFADADALISAINISFDVE